MPLTHSEDSAKQLEQVFKELLQTEISFIQVVEQLIKDAPLYQERLSAQDYALLEKTVREEYQPLLFNPFADVRYQDESPQALQASLQSLKEALASQPERLKHIARISFNYPVLIKTTAAAFRQAFNAHHPLPNLADGLIAPVTRFPRYILLLSEIQRLCPEDVSIKETVDLLKRQTKNLNTALVLSNGRYRLDQLNEMMCAYSRQDIWEQALRDVNAVIAKIEKGELAGLPELLYKQLTPRLHQAGEDALGERYLYCKVWLESFMAKFSQSKQLTPEQKRAFWEVLENAAKSVEVEVYPGVFESRRGIFCDLAYSGITQDLLQLCHDACQKDLFFGACNIPRLLHYWLPLARLQDRNGYSLHHQIVYAQHLHHEQKINLFNALLDCGLPADILSANQSTVLHSAFQDKELLSVLLSHPKIQQANLYNRLTAQGMSLLHLAVSISNPEKRLAITTAVLPYCDVNLADKHNGQTALHQAIAYGSADIVQLLIQRGCDSHKPDAIDVTPLHKAVICNKRELVKLLITLGANLHLAEAEKGYTPLHSAVANNNSDIIELLLSGGADINLGDAKNSCTPLYLAVSRNNEPLVILLLSRGANPNLAERQHGATPLHVAVARKNSRLILLLLSKNADPQVYLKNDTRRLDVYADKFDTAIGNLLRQRVAAFKPPGLLDKVFGKPAPTFIGVAPVANEATEVSAAMSSSSSSMSGVVPQVIPAPTAMPAPLLRTIPFSDVRLERAENGRVVKLGSPGGFGYVCKATWMYSTVAVKVLHHLREESINKFEKEANFLAAHPHPHLITLYGIHFDPIEDRYWIIMEFAAYGSLRSYLNQRATNHQPLNLSEQLELALQIAKPLAYIHNQNILHLDLKADNVLITTKQPGDTFTAQCEVKLTDFGLANTDDESVELISNPRGTLYWSAPEVLAYQRGNRPKEHFTKAADIYSYAILLWELMTQAIPYTGLRAEEVALQVRDESIQLRPEPKTPANSDKDLVSLMHHAWKHKPNERPIASELITRLGVLKSNLSARSATSSTLSVAHSASLGTS